MTDSALKSTAVVTPGGQRPALVLLCGGRIAEVLPYGAAVAAPVLDPGHQALLPGVIDPHVHLNEPGRTEWELKRRLFFVNKPFTDYLFPTDSRSSPFPAMEISALTRSVVRRTHAVIAPDGYINSAVPGWTGCTVNVLINEQMGARLCQTLVTLTEAGKLTGMTQAAQIFFYVVAGRVEAAADSANKTLATGQFVYVPVGQPYQFQNATAGTQILTFHKVYEPLDGHPVPPVLWGEKDDRRAPAYLNDQALRIQELLPNGPGFDMAVNIFTYARGGHLPMVETHVMEHGLLYLQGQAVYMLDQQWYPVKKGDAIWMAPYCQQWATAMGQEPSVYIYYKNVNRFPTVV